MKRLILLSILAAGLTVSAGPRLLDTVITFCCPETGPPQCPPNC